MNYRIRQLLKDDIPALLLLCSEHAEYEHSRYILSNQANDLVANIFISNPRLFCWVVEDDSAQLAGYCTYMLEFSTWKAAFFIHMDCLYLKPAARNKKLGQRLMEKMVLHAKELNIDEIQWQTPESNKNAIRFYNRIGASSKLKLRFFLDPAAFQPD